MTLIDEPAQAASAFSDRLAAVTAGDTEAVGWLYARFADQMVHFARRQGSAEPEGLVDEVMARMVRKAPMLSELNEKRFEAYLYTAVRNATFDELRKRQRTVRTSTLGAAGDPIDLRTTVETGVVGDESVALLLEDLTPLQRQVVRLRILEDQSLAQTAKEIGRDVAAVKSLQHRALLTMRAALGVAVALLLGVVLWRGLTDEQAQEMQFIDQPQIEQNGGGHLLPDTNPIGDPPLSAAGDRDTTATPASEIEDGAETDAAEVSSVTMPGGDQPAVRQRPGIEAAPSAAPDAEKVTREEEPERDRGEPTMLSLAGSGPVTDDGNPILAGSPFIAPDVPTPTATPTVAANRSATPSGNTPEPSTIPTNAFGPPLVAGPAPASRAGSQPTPAPTVTQPTSTPLPAAGRRLASTPRPTSTPWPTSTARPTSRSRPTLTPRPTSTTRPTSTPAARPSVQVRPTLRPTITPVPIATTGPTSTPRPTATLRPTTTPRPTVTPIPVLRPSTKSGPGVDPQLTATPSPTLRPSVPPRPTTTQRAITDPTPTGTSVIKPTATVRPTATPRPTSTPRPERPTATPRPTSTPRPERITGRDRPTATPRPTSTPRPERITGRDRPTATPRPTSTPRPERPTATPRPTSTPRPERITGRDRSVTVGRGG